MQVAKLSMAQTTRRVGNFLGVGNFAAKVLVEGL